MLVTKETALSTQPTTKFLGFGGWFVVSAALILALTGLAKCWTAFGQARILANADPFLGLSFGHLMLIVGVLELVIASTCFLAKSKKFKLALIALLATNFLVYRIGLLWIGWHKPCSCLGNLTDVLHIRPHVADAAMKIILAYLLIGSYGTLFWLWRQRKKTTAVTPAT